MSRRCRSRRAAPIDPTAAPLRCRWWVLLLPGASAVDILGRLQQQPYDLAGAAIIGLQPARDDFPQIQQCGVDASGDSRPLVPAPPLLLLPHALGKLRQPVEDGHCKAAVLVEVLLSFCGDRVALLVAFLLGDDITRLLQVGERRVNDARAWRIEAVGQVLDVLDDLVAVTGFLLDQRQDDQAQVALHEEPADAAITLIAKSAPMAAAMAPAAAPEGSAGHRKHGLYLEAPMPTVAVTVSISVLEHLDPLHFRYI
ncbi:protein of unknown function [Pseudorhizobium banfieldiae]|uniref:Uncharacterized protein n=1 Tax=Pseudorhizobium banfieldiae TaxID=1125847 RepID=L0NEP1_9HYPH|nr:protein of unknown function [Pseudorhizobium banfieldiae]